jgi:hypothetical protein
LQLNKLENKIESTKNYATEMNRYTYPTMADHLGDFTTARNGTKNWMERMSEERDNKKMCIRTE